MRPLTRRSMIAAASAAVGVLALTGCGGGEDPLASDAPDGDDEAGSLVVGSQDYYSNEIIAEIYAQALEGAGYSVERRLSIGQRDAYMPALTDGEIQVFPEYTGNLLQFFDPDTTATAEEDVNGELADALPEGLAALEPAPATDQDSYNVTADFAQQHGLSGIADLAGTGEQIVLGGPPELEQRPYGPDGLDRVYGLDVEFEATGDTTVQDLVAGTINVGNVFSADPRIETEDLVTLEDTEGLFLASNVVPVVAADLADELAQVLDPVDAALTPEDLVALNVESTEDERASADIAADWLSEKGLAA